MKLMPISTAQNQQTDFKGKVSKKTIRRINRYTKKIINNEIKIAKYNERDINEQFIKDTQNTRDNFIKKIRAFAEILHPDSVLSFKKTYDLTGSRFKSIHLSLKNKKSGKKTSLLDIQVWPINGPDKKIEKTKEIFKNIQKFNKNFVPSAEKAKIIETDMFIDLLRDIDYHMNMGISPKFIVLKKAKKIDKLAEEFGYPQDCLKMMEHSRSGSYPNCLYTNENIMNKILHEEKTNGILSSKQDEPISWEKYLEILKLRSQKNKAQNKEIIENLKKRKIL